MYITQKIADRIKFQVKRSNKSLGIMLDDLNLGINAISEFSKGKQLSCISLAKIADYLDVSVDYLLGRSENPMVNNSNNINQQNIVGNATAHIAPNTTERGDANAQELLDMIKQLSLVQRAEIILKINEMLKEK